MDSKRIGACTLGLRMLGLEPALDELKAMGFAGVDLWQVSPYYDNKGHISSAASPEECERVKSLAADRGMKLVHLASYPGMAFRKSDAAARKKDLAWGRETIDLCVKLGIPVMRVLTGPGQDLADLDTLVASLKETCAYAADRGIRLGMETHHGNLTASTADTRRVLDAVGRDNLGLLYDPGNLAPNDTYKETVGAFGDRIFHVHLKNVLLDQAGARAVAWADPDKGAVDFGWVMKALEESGYDGPVAVEYESFGREAAAAEAKAGLKSWLDFLSKV